MSLIIEDELFVFHKLQNENLNLSSHQPKPLSSFVYQNQLSNRNFQIIGTKQYSEDGRQYGKLIIPFKNKLFGCLDIWYSMTIDKNGICIQQKLLIAKDQFPYKVQPLKKKLEAMRQICRNKLGEPKFVKMYLSSEAIIQIRIPKTFFSQNIVNSFKYGLKNCLKSQVFSVYIENIVKFTIVDSKQTLKNIFNKLTDFFIQEQTLAKQTEKQNEEKVMKFQLFRYLTRSSIELRFDCTEGSALYQQVVDITVTQEKQISDRINHMREANLFKISSLGLYMQIIDMFEGKQKEAFYITAKQKQVTKNLLQIPQIIPTKQGIGPNNFILQNKYMFNHIVLELPRQSQKLNLLAESGFGMIEFGTFNFWYLMNSKIQKFEADEMLKQSNKIKNKYLVVKSPRQGFDQEAVRKYHSKQSHELNIINRLKGLSCALIPRFYKVQRFYPEAFTQIHQEYMSKYENALLSELTTCYGEPGYNVGHLIQQRWNILTLKKIIYIMSQVAQALRFLHLNKIIHLDLKPENILFMKNYSIKLIDFGQSFHPLVPYQDSTPAYSYPYGCPEIAQQCQSFTDKSDVFSFGVILYELLYGKDIFMSSPQKLLRQYRSKQYIKRIFYNPQQLQIYGQNIILPMLNHLIIKALSPDVQSRPSITWISVLLKTYLQVLP